MRTNEERAGLVHKRTAEIKRERQKKKQRALESYSKGQSLCRMRCSP